jgi:hypothetical protein
VQGDEREDFVVALEFYRCAGCKVANAATGDNTLLGMRDSDVLTGSVSRQEARDLVSR